MDEDLQAGRSLQIAFNLDLVDLAAQQQQPPLDYYVQGIFFKLLGTTTIAARLHAAFFGALSALVFLILLMHLFGTSPTTWFGAAVFITHPCLIRYSQEGRPISCGIFFATLYLYMLVTRVFEENSSRPWWSAFLWLLLTQAAFLLSVGFQPVIFVSAAFAGLLPFLFFKRFRIPAAIHTASTVAAFLCAWPVLLLTVRNGRQYLTDAGVDGLIFNFLTKLRLPAQGGLFEKIPAIAGDALPIWVAIAALGFVGLIGAPIYGALHALKDKPEKGPHFRNLEHLTLYLIIVFFLFLGLFDIAFHAFISYRIVPRYYMSAAPLLILLGVLLRHCALQSRTTLRLGRRASRVSAILLSLLFLSLCLVQVRETFQKIYTTEENDDWRGVYTLFKKNTERPAHAYMMNLVNVDRYHPYFFARRFYYEERPLPAPLADAFKLPAHLASSKFVEKTAKIFLCTMYGFNRVKSSFFKSLRGVHVHKLTSMAVTGIDAGENLRQTVFAFFRTFAKHAEVKEGNYKLFSILFELEHLDQNLKGMNAALQNLKRMDKRGKLAQRIKAYQKTLNSFQEETEN